MPTYDYLCEKCGPFEAQQSFQDEPLKQCPRCGAPVSRQFSKNVNFVFKGTGFYSTEHRSDEYKRQSAQEAKGPAPTCGNSDKPCPLAKGACPAQAAPAGPEKASEGGSEK
jgi:putative FmdB family regulatory protein